MARLTPLTIPVSPSVPARVTGFIGLDKAGTSTTLRLLFGPVKATVRTAIIDGRRYRDLNYWLGDVGNLLAVPVSES